ncbi:serine-rich adhesin for platelets isoform X2 [Planococcus citri]
MQEGNMVFSPYGVASVSVLLFEGSSGNTALEILRVLNLPWNALLARIGFRDMNRHLKTYFKSDGFLRGLIMSKDEVCFHYQYQRILRLYGFEEPERALTYPCHGFTSYTPDPVAQTTSTTESSVSVTSSGTDAATPATNGTTPAVSGETPASTELSTNADTIVTELTQTSQTIMVFNTTTLPSFTNVAADELQKLNSNITLNNETASTGTADATVSTDTTISRTVAETATFPQQTNSPNEILTSAASMASTLSSTLPSVDIVEKLNEPSPTTEITQMTQNNEVTIPFQDRTIEPSGSETIFMPISAPSDMSKQDFMLSESAPNSTLIKLPDRFNNSRSPKRLHRPPVISKASQEILKNEMKKILDKYRYRNFTNINDIIAEIEKDLKSNSSSESSSSSFPEDLLADLLASSRQWNSSENSISTSLSDEFDDISDFFGDNFTSLDASISSKQHFKDLLNATKFKLFNDTLKKLHGFDFDNNTFNFSHARFDHDISLEFTPFNYTSPPFFNSSEETSKELNGFYGTVVGFFENATQSFKDYFSGFSTTTVTVPTSEVLDVDLISTTPLPQADSNTTESAQKLNSSSSTVPTLVSQNNLTKSTQLPAENKTHVLPKKSISGKNENIPAASQLSPNYLNILSLRQSKLIETKFDIKGPHRPKKVFKRSSNKDELSEDLVKRSKNLDAANFVSNLISNATNTILRNEIANVSGIDQAEVGVRKARSTDDKKLESFRAGHFPINDDLDWFAVYDSRNTVRIPTFTYSAYLPYAYIDDLKSKVLEIPLDDSQYSLMILLPTHRYGLNYLLNSLKHWPVRKIHRQLRPLSVYAVIPKFRVASHVDLKPALYALGMKDIFYRYRADLSVMSPDARLYVRSIEQVVTVHVDKYPNAVYEVPEKLAESHFSASHPFIYFVIDKESKVSLVAGIMADPSKQHIHFV